MARSADGGRSHTTMEQSPRREVESDDDDDGVAPHARHPSRGNGGGHLRVVLPARGDVASSSPMTGPAAWEPSPRHTGSRRHRDETASPAAPTPLRSHHSPRAADAADAAARVKARRGAC